MGKVKKLRKKFHLSRERPESGEPGHFNVPQNDETTLQNAGTNSPLPNVSEENIFAGINIQFETLKKNLSYDDLRSVISTSKREFKKHLMSKKERRIIRHETFISKISSIQKLKKSEKERRRRQKRAVTGDLKPLVDALPSLECRKKVGKKRPPPKKKSIPKLKRRQKNMLHDVTSFKKLLQDPTFKMDPTTAVTIHIQEKIRHNVENA